MAKILVADDSIAVRKVAERLLTEAGFGVALAANGEEAITFLAKDRPDVIVSDVIMPDKSGYEVCAFVRNSALLAGTPVLLISGIVNDEVTKQAETCRADGVLKKPFQGTSLKDKVLELLAKRQGSSAPSALKPASDFPQPAVPSAGLKPHAPQLQTASPGLGVTADFKLDAGLHPVAAAHGDPQAAIKLRETEGLLKAERTRAETLVKRIAELEAETARVKETEGLLETERRRTSELEAKVAAGEAQLARIPELEAALRAEQEAASEARHDAAAVQHASDRIAQLEATLDAERAAAAQLVQQLTDVEAAAARGANAEAMLAREVERNAELARRVSEAEQAAAGAMKRFEEMARRLGEIAGLASQLGKGT